MLPLEARGEAPPLLAPRALALEQPPPQRHRVGEMSPTAASFAAHIGHVGLVPSGRIFMSEQACRDLLGPGFLSCFPPGRSPCINHFVFGHCSGPNCGNLHKWACLPSRAVLRGINERLGRAVDQYLQSQQPGQQQGRQGNA